MLKDECEKQPLTERGLRRDVVDPDPRVPLPGALRQRLLSIPEGTRGGAMDPITGQFAFDASNREGERVSVKGEFDFPAPAVEEHGIYCEQNSGDSVHQ